MIIYNPKAVNSLISIINLHYKFSCSLTRKSHKMMKNATILAEVWTLISDYYQELVRIDLTVAITLMLFSVPSRHNRQPELARSASQKSIQENKFK